MKMDLNFTGFKTNERRILIKIYYKWKKIKTNKYILMENHDVYKRFVLIKKIKK